MKDAAIAAAEESASLRVADTDARLMSSASAAAYLGIKEMALMEMEGLPEAFYIFGRTFYWAREIEAVGRSCLRAQRGNRGSESNLCCNRFLMRSCYVIGARA
jgi:hypothetical protein